MLGSGWSKSVFLLAALLPVSASAQYSEEMPRGHTVIRCESHDGRTQQCPIDVRGGVRKLRQMSRSGCEEGQSWGLYRGGVWVSRGCRGEFLVGQGGLRPDRSGAERFVRCDSNDGRSNHCAVDTRRGVELVRQLSRTACIRGQSWGVDENGVWVSGGCRAEFRTSQSGRRERRDRDEGSIEIVRCESSDGRASHCPVDTRGGVRMVQQLSRTACVEGESWGYDRRGIWVEHGCRAEFETGFRSDPDRELGQR